MSQSSKHLANRFIVGERIGRGGMGDVYLGTDIQTGESVAIKLLKPEIVQDSPDLVERFEREGEMLRRLNHPNIVKVLATIEEDGNHYIVMEYVSGGSLQDLIQSETQLPINRILEIALDIADALTRAHRLNIVHRDIKPANVLLAEDGTPRLTDFGVAHMGDRTRMTESGSVIGTYAYLSPEACHGEDLDERTDVWSFGVMLYEMIAGRRPFESIQPAAIIVQILTELPPLLTEHRPDMPPELVTLINTMLEKDRDKRIPTARRVGTELETLLRGLEPSMFADSQSAGSKRASRFATPTPSHTSPELEGQTITPEPSNSARVASKDSINIIVERAPNERRKSRRSGKWFPAVLSILVIIASIFLAIQIIDSGDETNEDQSSGQTQSNDGLSLSPEDVELIGNPIDEGDYLIIVAELEAIDTNQQDYSRFITEDLYQRLEQNIVSSQISVRQYPQIITSDDMARQVADVKQAAVIIWGRYTNDFIQLEIQIGSTQQFTYIPFPHDVVERATNLRVRLTNPFEETVAPHALSVLNGLQIANGNGFETLRTSAIVDQIGEVNSPDVIGNTVAAHSYRAYTLLYVNETTDVIHAQIEQEIQSALAIEQHPILYIQRSIWYWNQGRPQESREDALTAQRLATQSYQADEWTMPLYMFTINSTEETETIDIFNQIIEAHPDDWYALQVRGSIYYFRHQFDLARADLDRSITLKPNANFPYAFATMLAFREGRFEDAISMMHTVVTEFPDPTYGKRLVTATFGEDTLSFYGGFFSAFTNLALGQYVDVIRDTENTLENFPFSDLYFMQGIAYCNLDDYAAAERSYTAAIAMDEDFLILYFLRSGARFLQGNEVGATADMEVITESNPDASFEHLIEASMSGELTCENFFNFSFED